MSKHPFIAAVVALALAACADAVPSPVEPASPRPAMGDTWTIFTTQTPAQSGTFTGAGWEVATRFFTTKQVCVMYLRFWRAAGETGDNRITLWTNAGQKVVSRVADPSPSSGWAYAYVSSIVVLPAYTSYRVSVTTNRAQVKTFGAFQNGPIINGPLHATDGYYGQPTGVMPTTQSNSNFFVDVVVTEC